MNAKKIFLKVCFAFAVGLGLIAAFSLQANEPQPYHFIAHYQILSAANKPIGTYRIKVNGPEAGIYQLSGKIEFSFNRLGWFRYSYLSTDTVHYDEQGIKHYEIVEIDNGKRTKVIGNRSEDGAYLYITQIPDGADEQAISSGIPKASFDYSLYAFRFPLPCARQLNLPVKPLKILAPRTGQVESVYGKSTPANDLSSIPYEGVQCRLMTYDASGKTIKDSWFLADGILAFEKSANYQLKLTQVHYGQNN